MFRATVTDKDNESVHDGALIHWRIFDEQLIRVEIETVAQGTVMADYDFRVYTNPAGTGLHTYWGNPDCDSNGLGDTTNWVKGPELHLLLTRCGLGTAVNTGLVITARLSPDGQPFVVTNTRNFMLAAHADGGSISYQVNLEPVYGTRPINLDDDYFDKQVFVDSASDGAEALNRVVSQMVSEGTGVPVAPYWDGSGKCETLDHAGACHLGWFNDSSLPHYTRSEIWVRYPPSGYVEDTPTNWTDDFGVIMLDNSGIYRFLPRTLAHEFGHALGLEHLNVTGVDRLMGPVRENIRNIGIGDVDRDALREVTKPHVD